MMYNFLNFVDWLKVLFATRTRILPWFPAEQHAEPRPKSLRTEECLRLSPASLQKNAICHLLICHRRRIHTGGFRRRRGWKLADFNRLNSANILCVAVCVCVSVLGNCCNAISVLLKWFNYRTALIWFNSKLKNEEKISRRQNLSKSLPETVKSADPKNRVHNHL